MFHPFPALYHLIKQCFCISFIHNVKIKRERTKYFWKLNAKKSETIFMKFRGIYSTKSILKMKIYFFIKVFKIEKRMN